MPGCIECDLHLAKHLTVKQTVKHSRVLTDTIHHINWQNIVVQLVSGAS